MARGADEIARDKQFVNRQIKTLIDEMEEIMSKTTTRIAAENLKLLQLQLKETSAQMEELVKEESRMITAMPEKSIEQQEEALYAALYDTKSKCRKVTAKAEAVISDFRQKRQWESLVTGVDLNATSRDVGGAKANDTFLEKLKLHEFSGDHRTFLKFKTLFQSAIHKHPNLSKVRKLYYLQMYLKGEAAALVEDLPCTEESYDEAWSLICSRYDNKKTIAMLHFQDLFTIPNDIKEENLRGALDQVMRALKALKLCGEEPDNWESIIAYLVYSRLAHRIKADFDVTYKDQQKFFSWKVLYAFLDQRVVNNEARKIIENHSDRKRDKPSHEQKRSFAIGKPECVACDERHLLIECSIFRAKKPEERFDVIKKAALCTNCFRPGHISVSFKSSISCKICAKKHHTLLHLDYTPSRKVTLQASVQPEEQPSQGDKIVAYTNLVAKRRTILMPSAVVKVNTRKGDTQARVLLDNCSQSTMVADGFVEKHWLKIVKAVNPEVIRGVHGTPFIAKYECTINLKSRISVFELSIIAEVVPTDAVAYSIRGASMSRKFRKSVDIPLADTAFYEEKLEITKVDILLGAEYYEAIVLNETRAYEDVMLRNAAFGWTVTGPMRSATDKERYDNSKFCNLTIQDVQEQLEALMKLEKPPKQKEAANKFGINSQANGKWEMIRTEEGRLICLPGMVQTEFCVAHFDATCIRNSTGQFSMRFPFVTDPNESIVCNRRQAVNNLLYTERKRKEVEDQYI